MWEDLTAVRQPRVNASSASPLVIPLTRDTKADLHEISDAILIALPTAWWCGVWRRACAGRRGPRCSRIPRGDFDPATLGDGSGAD